MEFIKIKNFLKSKSLFFSSDLSNDFVIQDLCSLDNSKSNSLTFYSDNKFIESIKKTNAKCCLITKNNVNLLPNKCYSIIVDNPYLVFAHLTNLFNPSFSSNGIISKKATIDIDVNLGLNIQIDDFVVIKKNVTIGDNVIILNNSVIGPNVFIGDNSTIYPNCSISNANIGNNCLFQSGTVIGDRGFGFAIKEKIELVHVGNVKIGNNVHIGSNCTIDKALLDSTIIGNNVRIDNLVHIAHGVSVGEGSVIAAQVGIAGSTQIGSNCLMGGQVGISGHLRIGDNVKIGGKSGVTKNIDNNMTIAGFPAIDIKKWKKNLIKLNKN